MVWTIRGSNGGSGKRFFSFPKGPDPLRCPPTNLFNGYGGSFFPVERPEDEVYHSRLSSAEFKNEWSYTFTPTSLYAFMALRGINLLFFTFTGYELNLH
jgi:hypothetical protein